MYADTQVATPKQYTYEEWQYFLRLLGEKEDDPSLHKKAPTHREEREAQRAEEQNQAHDQDSQEARGDDPGRQGGAYPGGGEGDEDVKVAKWSWIGSQSPLMGDKEEAEWLLERFFQRLEESLKSDAKTNQTEQMGRGKEYATGIHDSRQKGDGSSSSEKTVSHS